MTSAPIPVTAVFDIGKTNKKFLLFDENYSIVYKNSVKIEETEDDDGFPCDDLDKLVLWLKKEFKVMNEDQKYLIRAINFSTYGATLVHLDESGKPVTPLYNYLKPYPPDLLSSFYEKYGGRQKFSVDTASPSLGMLNSGLQLYWLMKKKPDLFQKIRYSLHLPQYISFLFSEIKASELTSIGCHTAMWNFRDMKYHSWLEKEKTLDLLPEILPVFTKNKYRNRDGDISVGVGIHDSSAALVPYLMSFEKPFIQVSTGTWSISMNPYTTDPLLYEELQRDCLLYINIYGKAVKASRFFLGNEYTHQIEKLNRFFGVENKEKETDLNPSMLKKIADNTTRSQKLILEKANNSGPYSDQKGGKWDLTGFKNFEEAYHQLMLDLVSIQADSLKLAEGSKEVGKVVITGGFGQNPFFTGLLAAFFPEKEFYSAFTSHASALGAALVVSDKQNDRNILKKILRLNRLKPSFDPKIVKNYSWSKSTQIK